MKIVFNNRKTLYSALGIVIIFIFTLTIVYAALNAVLKINGNAEVVASSWDIYLDNVQLVSGSATSNVPTIIDKTTASFQTTLTNPGDFYMFTIDVVNNGSIGAMIESIEKLPELTENQAKYLNYIVEYESGESINIKQLVEKDSFVRLKVKVEYRKDLVASDLPSVTETLNLLFKVNYTQAEESGTSSIQNSGKLIKVVSGDGTKTSDEVCIGKECFYVISSDEETITMLSKYNLLVGNNCYNLDVVPIENPTGIQDQTAIGWFQGHDLEKPIVGTVTFADTYYWEDTVVSYPSYVYNKNSNVYEYVENYKDYLEGLGTIINEARLITMEELEDLGCSRTSKSCSDAPSWVSSTTYWSGTAIVNSYVWCVFTDFEFAGYGHNYPRSGVRPVITISKSLL